MGGSGNTNTTPSTGTGNTYPVGGNVFVNIKKIDEISDDMMITEEVKPTFSSYTIEDRSVGSTYPPSGLGISNGDGNGDTYDKSGSGSGTVDTVVYQGGYASIPGDDYGVLRGETFEEKVWLYLKDNGFNDVQAAAIMGNMKQECGTNDYEDRMTTTDGYYGIFQQSLTYNPYIEDLDIKGQLDYMIYGDPRTSDSRIDVRMDYWHKRPDVQSDSYATFMSYDDPSDLNSAAEAFMYGYEGTLYDQQLSNRQAYAAEYYDKFAGMS